MPQEGLATSADEAVGLAEEIGYPVVLKIVSPDILHKTEAKGVLVGLSSSDEVSSGYDSIVENAKAYNADASITGVQVQRMLPEGQEVLIGAISDPDLRPGGHLRPRRDPGRGAARRDVPARADVDRRRGRRWSTGSAPPRCCAACAAGRGSTARRSPT